jgi:putative hemolysin
LNDSLKLNLPVGEAHTLAGFLINRLRHIPEVGDTVLEQGYRYTVTEADARTGDQGARRIAGCRGL